MSPLAAAVSSRMAWVAALGTGLPAFILIFLLAVSASVPVEAAFGRAMLAFVLLGGLGWVGGAIVGQLPPMRPAASETVESRGQRIDVALNDRGDLEQHLVANDERIEETLGDPPSPEGVVTESGDR